MTTSPHASASPLCVHAATHLVPATHVNVSIVPIESISKKHAVGDALGSLVDGATEGGIEYETENCASAGAHPVPSAQLSLIRISSPAPAGTMLVSSPSLSRTAELMSANVSWSSQASSRTVAQPLPKKSHVTVHSTPAMHVNPPPMPVMSRKHAVGTAVGLFVGTAVGVIVGNAVGVAVGVDVGQDVGITVGTGEGAGEGTGEGADVGIEDGVDVGIEEGADDGTTVGHELGSLVGADDGGMEYET